MPVLINRETGLAENVNDELAQQAVAQSHDLPLNDPEGNPVIAPYEEASQLLQQGYSQPTPENLQNLLDNAKFGTGTEQLKTAVEGAASAATFGLSTAIERGLGVKAEDIQKRREINPGSYMAGQAVGLGASLLTGVGPAALAERGALAAGEAVAGQLGANAIGRVGSAATKAAIENAVFQAGDEVSKMFYADPQQTVETAVSDIGLSALIGGGFGGAIGGAGELWRIGPGKKIDQLLGAIKNRASGLPSELKTAADIDLAPEIEAALGNSPQAKEAAQTLMQSNSGSGKQFQEAMENFHNTTRQAVAETLGKTTDDISSLSNISKYDEGVQIQKKLSTQIKEIADPISAKYDALEQQFKSAKMLDNDVAELSNNLVNFSAEQGYAKMASSPQLKLVNEVLSDLPKQTTAQDLRNYVRNLKEAAPFGSENYQVVKSIGNILDDTRDAIISREVSSTAPQLMDEFVATQAEYKNLKGLLGELNDRLRVGKQYGPGSFAKALNEMAPEDVVNRLSLKDDFGLQQLLNEKFPSISESVRNAELNKVLKASLDKTAQNIDPKKLWKNLEKLSPELRSYLIPEDAQIRLNAIKNLLDNVPDSMNTSGTAKTLDKLWQNVPASATGVASILTGNNPISGFILGKLAFGLNKEVPDAIRLGMLKFLSSDSAINSSGLKAAVELAEATIKGETKFNKAIKSIFSTGRMLISEPAESDRKKLKKQIEAITENPEKLLEVGGDTGHYMPDHGAAMSESASRIIQYLATLKPIETPAGPLNNSQKPSKVAEADYNRALNIAQQPLIILDAIKQGTITTKDIQHLNAMYPGLVQKIQMKLNDEILNNVDAKKEIPYKTKVALSIFMAQPLDASMNPDAIIANQMYVMPVQAPQPMKATKSMNQLTKLPQSYYTPEQARSANRGTRVH